MTETNVISIAAEEFVGKDKQSLFDILDSELAEKYVGSLKFSTGMFVDRSWIEELSQYYRLIDGAHIPVIADLSLSGGYSASVKEAESVVSRHGFMSVIFTLSRIPEDEVEYIRDNIQPKSKNQSIEFLLTGALPENDSAAFKKEYKISRRAYTAEKIETARRLGVKGVYASAGLITADADVFTLGAGVNFDGQAYESNGVIKKSVDISEATRRSTQFVLGRALFNNDRSIMRNFELACEQVDLALSNR